MTGLLLADAGHHRVPAQDHPHAFPQATEAGNANVAMAKQPQTRNRTPAVCTQPPA
jgi:hypothetical protein